MNKIRDGFVIKLLNVYYGLDIKKLNCVLVQNGEDFLHKHYVLSFKTGGTEYLVMKQYAGDAPLEWRLHSEKKTFSSIEDFAFGMRLKTGDYLYFLHSGPGMYDDLENVSGPMIIKALNSLALICPEDEDERPLSFPLVPGSIRIEGDRIVFTDINKLGHHEPGYPLWGLYYSFGMEKERFIKLLYDYYTSIEIPGDEMNNIAEVSFREYSRDNPDINGDIKGFFD